MGPGPVRAAPAQARAKRGTAVSEILSSFASKTQSCGFRPIPWAGRPAVPAHLSWDEWVGVAPERAYHPAYLPFKWRGWYDFGAGALGDMACHTVNLAYMGLELTAPTEQMPQSEVCLERVLIDLGHLDEKRYP